jgi:hypothetical protein
MLKTAERWGKLFSLFPPDSVTSEFLLLNFLKVRELPDPEFA